MAVPIKIDEKTGRLVRPNIYELAEQNRLLEEALKRAELELLTQKKRFESLIEELRRITILQHLYIPDTSSARSRVEAERYVTPDVLNLFNPDNIR
jgi:hypothetical protein